MQAEQTGGGMRSIDRSICEELLKSREKGGRSALRVAGAGVQRGEIYSITSVTRRAEQSMSKEGKEK